MQAQAAAVQTLSWFGLLEELDNIPAFRCWLHVYFVFCVMSQCMVEPL